MDSETRDVIGRALYEATADFTDSRTPAWDALLNKEMWILRAEKVVEAYEKCKQER